MGKRHMQRQNPYRFGVAIKLRGNPVRHVNKDEKFSTRPFAPDMDFGEAQKLKNELVDYFTQFGKKRMPENVEYATLIRE